VKIILKEILELIRASMPTTIDIRRNIVTNRAVLADPVEIHQVLMNLCTNAYHAMREKGGVLDITLTDITLPTDDYSLKLRMTPGPYIKLEVRDTGSGISDFVMERIFEPYFTTKGRGEGTGLGLAMVHGIVTSLNGDVTVSSKVGEGTAFTVYIPRLDVSSHKSENSAISKLSGGNERILLVDDEEPIYKMIKKTLERLGYHVTVHKDSLSALDEFKNSPEAFDLLITDMTMPKMTGLELSRRILSIRSDFPILLLTGYSHQVTEDTIRSFGIRELVMKPVLRKELAEAVRRALDRDV